MSAGDPAHYDPSREPYAGIDPRVMGREVDPTTGEVTDPPPPTSTTRPVQDRRMYGQSGDASAQPWPPRSSGPLPPDESIPPDLNIGTALDEIDAWAHEHDRVTTELSRIRVLLSGDPADPEYQSLEARLVLRRALFRRQARASPTERGRRTADDISTEVDEALEKDGIAGQVRTLEAEVDNLMGRLFRARDNIRRLENYIKTLGRPPNG